MAQLPIYRNQGNITIGVPGQIRDIQTFSESSVNMQKTGNMLLELSARWQESKDAVETLDGRNKLNSGIAEILNEASNYNDYSTPEELSQKENELTQKMNNLVPDIVSGFSNNQKAREFESNGQFTTQNNIYKLQNIFREKYGDMYNANLLETGDRALKDFTTTGNEAYKQEYYNAIDTGVQAGYLDRTQAEKLKLTTDDWNYDYVYSQILENPYFQASEEVMSKIDPVKQRTLRNFARAEQKKLQQEQEIEAVSDFISNPTPKNLKRVHRTNRKTKKNPTYQKIADNVPNYETVSNISGYADAVSAIKELADLDTTSYNGKQQLLGKAGDIAAKILSSNAIKDGSATLSTKEANNAMQMLYKTMRDETFKEQMKSLPNLNRLKSEELAGTGNPEKMKAFDAERLIKATTEWKKIDDIGKRTCENVISHFLVGDVQGGLQAYESGLKAAIKQKYWYIPELQNPNLQPGTKFTVAGNVYTFQGFTQKDIIVKVD